MRLNPVLITVGLDHCNGVFVTAVHLQVFKQVFKFHYTGHLDAMILLDLLNRRSFNLHAFLAVQCYYHADQLGTCGLDDID